MKTIGLIGGMSWESTAIYYRDANRLVRDALGGLNSAEILLTSLNFAEVAELQRNDDWEAAGELLARHASKLVAAGAEMILICTNTMHIVHPRVQSAVPVPVLHIADTLAAAVTEQHLNHIAVLGTKFTMEQPFLRDRLATHEISTVIPDAVQRDFIHNAIFTELAHGQLREKTRTDFQHIMKDLVAAGAQGIALACTEIELLITESDAEVPIFPTAAIHIAAAIDQSI